MNHHRKTLTFERVSNAAAITMLLVGLACMARISPAHADGGVAQFTKHAGPFVVTVFTTPSPLRAGPVDVSVMIQSSETGEPVLDCAALIQLYKEGAASIQSAATHYAAQNKLFYAALLKVPESGLWQVDVSIKHAGDSIDVAGVIIVAPSNPALLVYWRNLALQTLFIALFVLNQWLKRWGVKGATR